ncbi:hypothetical protein BC834DRAFT_885970, partial [Gloeopeniophorella convolvens]
LARTTPGCSPRCVKALRTARTPGCSTSQAAQGRSSIPERGLGQQRLRGATAQKGQGSGSHRLSGRRIRGVGQPNTLHQDPHNDQRKIRVGRQRSGEARCHSCARSFPSIFVRAGRLTGFGGDSCR